MSIVLQSSGGGSITINEPTTASNFTQSLPAATGTVMVSGNMPMFSAYNSTDQTIAYNTVTKLNFDSEEFDTNNNFASSLFTPTVAGYYQINVKVYNSATALRNYYFSNRLYKNGSVKSISAIAIYQLGSAAEFCVDQSKVVYMNGTTDYLEVYSYNIDYTSSASTIVAGGSSYTSFNGILVRAE